MPILFVRHFILVGVVKQRLAKTSKVSLHITLNLTHMSNRKNPGNTKYVFDGHWFMEIDGNC